MSPCGKSSFSKVGQRSPSVESNTPLGTDGGWLPLATHPCCNAHCGGHAYVGEVISKARARTAQKDTPNLRIPFANNLTDACFHLHIVHGSCPIHLGFQTAGVCHVSLYSPITSAPGPLCPASVRAMKKPTLAVSAGILFICTQMHTSFTHTWTHKHTQMYVDFTHTHT